MSKEKYGLNDFDKDIVERNLLEVVEYATEVIACCREEINFLAKNDNSVGSVIRADLVIDIEAKISIFEGMKKNAEGILEFTQDYHQAIRSDITRRITSD